MGFSPTFIVCNLYILATAITVHATSSGREGNSVVFLGAADQELSAAALNVPVDFQPYEETWGLFKKTFGRQYRNDAEETHKYRTFVENAKKIERHNAQFRNGNATFWMGINRFADMDLEEYQAFIRRLAPTNGSAPFGTLKCSAFVPPSLAAASSDSVDWRKKGYVTEVKNQKSCGSCWAFSATGSLEGQHFRKTGKLVSLSEQQLVDCAGTFGNKGCDGGYETAAFAYIFSARGINSETDYPYEAQQGKCRFVKSKVAATLSGCKLIQPAIEKVLQASVRSKGPVSVAIDASSDSFRHYAGGVYVNSKCGKEPKDLDHAVLAVGYGTQGTAKDYWIVKNSWGKTWGQKGYILMARNRGNMCGIATAATFPVV